MKKVEKRVLMTAGWRAVLMADMTAVHWVALWVGWKVGCLVDSMDPRMAEQMVVRSVE